MNDLLLVPMQERCVVRGASYRILAHRILLKQAVAECLPPELMKTLGQRGWHKRVASPVIERLRNYETETLHFMTDVEIPFNNQGENNIHM